MATQIITLTETAQLSAAISSTEKTKGAGVSCASGCYILPNVAEGIYLHLEMGAYDGKEQSQNPYFSGGRQHNMNLGQTEYNIINYKLVKEAFILIQDGATQTTIPIFNDHYKGRIPSLFTVERIIKYLLSEYGESFDFF